MGIERWIVTLPLRLRSLLCRRAVDADLDDEIRDHVERQVAHHIAAGMSPGEARTAAMRAFGGVEYHKEAARDARGFERVDGVARNVRQSLRVARRSPAFSLVVVASLALGIGATTAVFGISWNVLLAPLDVPHPEALVSLARADIHGTDDTFSWAEYRTLRDAAGVRVTASRGTDHHLFAFGDTREYAPLDVVDGTFFATIGVRPLRGRLITAHDDDAQAAVVVLSERLSERLFGRDSAAVGRTIAIHGAPFTVVGITPASWRGLDYPGAFTAAIPISAAPLAGETDVRRLDGRTVTVVARRDTTPAAAAGALAVQFARCCGIDGRGVRERLELVDMSRGIPGGKDDVRADVRTTFIILLAGMALVLLVVCCNIASLLIVRAAARQREIAVRLSLGASRARLVVQLVTESVPLAILGGVGGLVVALWTTSAFVAALPANWSGYAEIARFRPGFEVLAFTTAITILCLASFAVYPAFRATGAPLVVALRAGIQGSRGASLGVVARGVVVAQVMLTLMLVAASGPLTATARNLTRLDAGFATDNVLLAAVETRGTSYEPAGIVPVHDGILRRVRALRGVRVAGMGTLVPMFGGRNARVRIEVPGFDAAAGEKPPVPLDAVTPGYFAATGIRLLSGREFTPADGAGNDRVVILSAAVARRYFAERDPIGQSVRTGDDSLTTKRVVGVVADAKYLSLRADPEPMVYAPVAQAGRWPFLELVIRTDRAPDLVAPAMVRAIEAAAPGVRTRRVTDMRAEKSAAMAVELLVAWLAGFVSVMALVLAAVGLYGVVAYSVARRTSEIGIRIALGATTRAVVSLVVKETIAFTGLGVLIGVPLSFAANSVLGSQLFGVGAHDPSLMAGAIATLLFVALVASALPAGRVARIDPRVALGAE